jgi:hypothetical protein
MFVPFGGSSSTETTHSPASSIVWSCVCVFAASFAVGAKVSRSRVTSGTPGSRRSSSASRIAAI